MGQFGFFFDSCAEGMLVKIVLLFLEFCVCVIHEELNGQKRVGEGRPQGVFLI